VLNFRAISVFIVIVCSFLQSKAQAILWADEVIEFSSQKSPKAFAATQALGKPSRYPNPSFSTCAWSPEFAEFRNTEFIHIGFNEPVIAKQILIVENNNSGHIQEIWIYNTASISRKIYQRSTPAAASSGRLFVASLKDNFESIKSIRIVFDKPDLMNTYQIDAIGATTASNPVTLSVNTVVDSFNYKATSLGPLINSPFDEVCPIISPDGKSLYFDRKLHPDNIGLQKNDDIWLSELIGSEWSNPINIGEPLNNSNHNFICAISPDGKTALVGNVYAPENTEAAGVSISYKMESGWSNPYAIKINDFNNLNQYNEFTLSADGSALVMSLETIEGKGLLDLYVSFQLANRTYSTPINLGTQINTAGNEMTPFLAADGKTLYFSSNGFPGFGNQDIFMVRRLDNTWNNWSEPINLGEEVNTPEWDVYYSIDAKGEYAYFSSSKTTGTNLDIFRVKLPPQAQPEDIMWLKGKVLDKINTEAITANLSISSVDENGNKTIAFSREDEGYAIILPQLGSYLITIQSEGYYSTDTLINIDILTSYNEVIQDFRLIPKKAGVIIEMKNILFKVNSSVLEDTSYSEIDKVVKFMQSNAGVAIEIRGHTNGYCDDDYCNSLSAKRAKAVVDYCITNGIAMDRLTSKGLGKTMPIADNATSAGRQANQRVEFMITKVE